LHKKEKISIFLAWFNRVSHTVARDREFIIRSLFGRIFMNSPLIEFALLSFVSLFTMVNPLGAIPIFSSMTAALPLHQARRTAFRASLTAFIILVLFALSGQWVFNFFHISLHSLRVVGGIIFFIMGYEMLQARLTRTMYDDETQTQFVEDIAITPLGIPMICGPGAITSAIILMNQSQTLVEKGILLAVILFVLGLTYFILVSGKRILKLLGDSGNKVLLRLMGLIVMMIAVEFFFAGLKPIVKDMVLIHP
jgi:multiple antibiotic resistance protein